MTTQVGPTAAPAGARVAAPSAAMAAGRYIEWGAVLAGAVLAAAVSFVLLTFGATIGLSFVSPWADQGLSARWIASLAVLWTMAQQIGAFLIGGYVAGRMRSRWADASQDEAEFRDGMHGALVWAVGLVIGTALLLSAAGAIARTGAEVGARVATVAATTSSNPLDYYVDVVMRPQSPAARPAGTAPRAAASPGQSEEMRGELLRIFTRAIAGGALSDPDRTYLAGIVAQRTGLPLPEAEKRVTDTFAEASRATKEAADKARRAAILTGFVTAASLLTALGAAWWAALKGGHHRDNAIPARLFAPLQRRPAP